MPGVPGGTARTLKLDDFFQYVGQFELFVCLWLIAFAVAWEQITTSLAVTLW